MFKTVNNLKIKNIFHISKISKKVKSIKLSSSKYDYCKVQICLSNSRESQSILPKKLT